MSEVDIFGETKKRPMQDVGAGLAPDKETELKIREQLERREAFEKEQKERERERKRKIRKGII